MMKARFIVVLAAMLALLTGALAQESTYRLQPEDVIRIQVYNEPQVNAVLPIGRDGYLSAPFVGRIFARGKTTTELEADLAKEYNLKLRLKEPKVSVTIEQFRPVRAAVIGAVPKAGVYIMRPTDTLMTLLANGGGASATSADLRRATLRRAGSNELIPIDLYAMLIRGDTSQNYTVEDGDELTVPEETRNRVLILGAVQRPGTYPFREPMTVTDALSLGGGEIRYRTKLSNTLIIRERTGLPGNFLRIKLDLVKFFAKGDMSQNVLLQPGDTIFFGETKTPDLDRVGALLNGLFIFDRFGFFRVR